MKESDEVLAKDSLGGYKDADHHIKFRMSDIQRHLQRKAKEGRP